MDKNLVVNYESLFTLGLVLITSSLKPDCVLLWKCMLHCTLSILLSYQLVANVATIFSSDFGLVNYCVGHVLYA